MFPDADYTNNSGLRIRIIGEKLATYCRKDADEIPDQTLIEIIQYYAHYYGHDILTTFLDHRDLDLPRVAQTTFFASTRQKDIPRPRPRLRDNNPCIPLEQAKMYGKKYSGTLNKLDIAIENAKRDADAAVPEYVVPVVPVLRDVFALQGYKKILEDNYYYDGTKVKNGVRVKKCQNAVFRTPWCDKKKWATDPNFNQFICPPETAAPAPAPSILYQEKLYTNDTCASILIDNNRGATLKAGSPDSMNHTCFEYSGESGLYRLNITQYAVQQNKWVDGLYPPLFKDKLYFNLTMNEFDIAAANGHFELMQTLKKCGHESINPLCVIGFIASPSGNPIMKHMTSQPKHQHQPQQIRTFVFNDPNTFNIIKALLLIIPTMDAEYQKLFSNCLWLQDLVANSSGNFSDELKTIYDKARHSTSSHGGRKRQTNKNLAKTRRRKQYATKSRFKNSTKKQ